MMRVPSGLQEQQRNKQIHWFRITTIRYATWFRNAWLCRSYRGKALL